MEDPLLQLLSSTLASPLTSDATSEERTLMLTQLLQDPISRYISETLQEAPDASSWSWTVVVDKIGTNSDIYIARGSNGGRAIELVVKHATNDYSKPAILREQKNLLVISKHLAEMKSTLSIPRPLGPLGSHLQTHQASAFLHGVNGMVAMNSCQSDDERLSLARALGRVAKE
ncbi:hypothetical protein HDU67_003526, partial [Dinochytrium kinnereticum]